MIKLNYKYSHDYISLYWEGEWLCQYFTVEYEIFEPNSNHNESSSKERIPLSATIEAKKKKITIPIGMIIHNNPALYEEMLPKVLSLTHSKEIRGKIRDYMLFVRYIDDKKRDKFNNKYKQPVKNKK